MTEHVVSRRDLLIAAGIVGVTPFLADMASAAEAAVADWTSAQVAEGFGRFAQTHRMPADLQTWLNEPAIQCIEPYRVFDNVWNVGIRWVCSYAVRTSDGWALIDTLHEPFVDRLFENLRTIGVPLDDIKYVFMTHGHFDHVGGYYKLRPALKNARFVMSQRGWDEAIKSARASEKGRNAWKMDEHIDIVGKDGDPFTLGETTFTLLETPDHTWGTSSYMYDVQHNGERHVAVTVGGQGLNAIEGVSQIDAYIASMKRLGDPALGIDVDLTAHPFSTGLTEMIPTIKSLKPTDKHPLINREAYCARLARLIANAEKTKARMTAS